MKTYIQKLGQDDTYRIYTDDQSIDTTFTALPILEKKTGKHYIDLPDNPANRQVLCIEKFDKYHDTIELKERTKNILTDASNINKQPRQQPKSLNIDNTLEYLTDDEKQTFVSLLRKSALRRAADAKRKEIEQLQKELAIIEEGI